MVLMMTIFLIHRQMQHRILYQVQLGVVRVGFMELTGTLNMTYQFLQEAQIYE